MTTLATIEKLVQESFERLDGKLDSVRLDVLENRSRLTLYDHRLGVVEKDSEKVADKTGAHQSAEIERLKDSRTHWVRYIIGALVTLVIAAFSSGIALAFK